MIVPCSGLPLARRSAGISMPWSQLLRTRWVSGSVIFSTRPLSSSVASPCVTSSTFLPSLAARSRSMRGKRLKTIDIGIMRIDITDSCRSRVLRSRSARPAASCWCSAGVDALAVLRQHGLRDDELADQVDQLVDLLDRHAQRRRLRAAAAACRRARAGAAARAASGLAAAGAVAAAVAGGSAGGRARCVVEEAVAGVGAASAGGRAGRAFVEAVAGAQRRQRARARGRRGSVNRSSRSLSLLRGHDLEAAHAVGALAAVERLDRAEVGDLLEQVDQVVGHARVVERADASVRAGARRRFGAAARRRPVRRGGGARRRRGGAGGRAAAPPATMRADVDQQLGGVDGVAAGALVARQLGLQRVAGRPAARRPSPRCGASSWRRSLSSSVSIWCVSSATSAKPKVAAPPLTECAQRKIAFSSSSSARVDVELEQHAAPSWSRFSPASSKKTW